MQQLNKETKCGVILHSGAIGDCLLTLPLATYIKKVYALDRLEFIGPTDYIGFYPGRTCIDAVRSIESIGLHRLFEEPASFMSADNRRLGDIFGHYEQIVSFIGFGHASFENNLLFTVHSTHSAEVTLVGPKPDPTLKTHVSDSYLDVFKQQQQLEDIAEPDNVMIAPLPDDYVAGSDLVEQIGIDSPQRIVVIHPGSGAREKCWHWENFIGVASGLRDNNVHPVFLLGPAERERFPEPARREIRRYPVLEHLSLTQVLQVLTQADAFLGNDSGIGHLAGGMGKRTLVLFGSDNSVHYAPRGKKARVTYLPQGRFQNPTLLEQAMITKTFLEMLEAV